MSMDLDLDLDSDRISNFLQSKLDEIKSANAKLEKSLQHRQELSKILQQEIKKKLTSNTVQITKISKKIFFDKYVLFVKLRNESEMILKNINVLLTWNLPSSLSYRFYIVSETSPPTDLLKCTNHFQQLGTIIIVFEMPYYSFQCSCTISGSIIFEQDCKKITMRLPSNVELTPQDVVDESAVAQKMINGSIDDFLACAFASEKHEFVMVIPTNWTRLLETALEIDCSLYRLNITANKTFFLVHKICPLLEGTLLELHNKDLCQNRTADVNFYCRSEAILLTLLNLLRFQLKDVQIVPKMLYNSEISYHETTELIKDSVINELKYLETISDKNLIEFKSDMLEFEHETDVLVARIKENAM